MGIGISLVGIAAGVALVCTGVIFPGVPMIIICAGCLAAAIFFFIKDRKAASEAKGDTSPQVNSQDPKTPPSNDEHPDIEPEPGFHPVDSPHAVHLSPVDDADFPLDPDFVLKERAQTIAKELRAWDNPENAARWLRQSPCRSCFCTSIQIFLALRAEDSDFANRVLAAAESNTNFNAISLLPKLFSANDEVCNGVLDKWATTDFEEQVQIFEYAKVVNPDLAQRMQARMKDDELFGLYLRVMAAGGDPSEAAKMVMGEDGKLTDTGAKVLQWIPTAVAAKIFTVILDSQSDGGDAQWESVRDSNLSPWLLCSMDPKQAADVLLKMGKYDPNDLFEYLSADIESFVRFMRFNPEATAHILAHMPKVVIKSIFGIGMGSAATLARITPFLQKFNPQLAAQLFPESLQDMLKKENNIINNIFISMFFSIGLKEIISAFRSSQKNRIRLILEHMITGSNTAQMREIVQILKVSLQESLLDYKEACNVINRSMKCWSSDSCNGFAEITLHQALTQNFPDDMLARIVCHLDESRQQEFLETLPETRRKAIQKLIKTIGAD
jgi:hypothetical protein